MKKQNILGAVALISTFIAPVVMAEDSAATTAMTAIKAEAAALATAAWPIVTAIVVATIGMKLFKKFANKST